MDNRLKISGIYDRKTLKSISALEVNHAGFDFRPKSFNFLQEHVFLEMIESCYRPSMKYYLHFENEVDFVVQKLIDDLSEVVARLGHNLKENFVLDFSDVRESSFYDSFGLPFGHHFVDFETLEQVLPSNHLEMVTIDYSYIDQLNQSSHLVEFVTEMRRMCNKLSLALKIDWDTDVMPSLSEFLPVDVISLAINHKTELSYRNVDTVAVKRHLQRSF